jgi:alkanesulfonate monooxygenase SsuD/methylene tetrahydromethanopterin reductase-like flavin-dependent oxidoreductase (luciferase family)
MGARPARHPPHPEPDPSRERAVDQAHQHGARAVRLEPAKGIRPTVFVPDHFGNQIAPVAALTGAAGATTSLRIGPLVLDNDYRHPVVTAKEMASLDLLSDGRLELGIGAGWMASDYEQAGIPPEAASMIFDPDEGLAEMILGHDAYDRAAPYWHCYLGIERYWRKRRERKT